MPKKNVNTRKKKQQNLEVNTQNIKILRSLKNEEAFYFYEALNKPTGESARSLSDFLEKVKTIKLESLLFHLQRNDFKNWIVNTLGDEKLAKTMETIIPSNDEQTRKKIRTAVENRVRELTETSENLHIYVEPESLALELNNI